MEEHELKSFYGDDILRAITSSINSAKKILDNILLHAYSHGMNSSCNQPDNERTSTGLCLLFYYLFKLEWDLESRVSKQTILHDYFVFGRLFEKHHDDLIKRMCWK